MSDDRAEPTIFDASLTRRDLLKRAGMGALAYPTLSALIAACGVGGKEPAARPSVTLSPLPSPSGEIVIANWELYIDPQVWKDWAKATGKKVTYKESILDNEQFYGVIQPQLAAGKPTGWDIIVHTDWLIAKMARLGYLEPLHHDRLPNFAANAGAIYKNPNYDPGNTYSLPWQGGITGIAYDISLTKRPITKTEDLFDPAFKGKVGMFTEMRDTVNLILLNIGIKDLQKATLADVERAMAKLRKQRDDGIVRDYYDNSYADALARGDIALSVAWSGDVIQLTLDNPNLRFVVPDEGGVLWVDNMCIPKGAAHPTDAHEWMNHVYDTRVAATIAEYVNYVTPVPSTKDVILADAAAAKGEDRTYLEGVAKSELVFPTTASEAKLQRYKILTEAEEKTWNDMFQEASEG